MRGDLLLKFKSSPTVRGHWGCEYVKPTETLQLGWIDPKPGCQTLCHCQVPAMRQHTALPSTSDKSWICCLRFNPSLPVLTKSVYRSIGACVCVCVCVTHVNLRCILLCCYITVPAHIDRYYRQHTLAARLNYLFLSLTHTQSHTELVVITRVCGVCVCERERERESDTHTQTVITELTGYLSTSRTVATVEELQPEKCVRKFNTTWPTTSKLQEWEMAKI